MNCSYIIINLNFLIGAIKSEAINCHHAQRRHTVARICHDSGRTS